MELADLNMPPYDGRSHRLVEKKTTPTKKVVYIDKIESITIYNAPIMGTNTADDCTKRNMVCPKYLKSMKLQAHIGSMNEILPI